MNTVRPNNLSLKYQKFTPSGCKDLGNSKFEFVAQTFMLWGSMLDSSIKVLSARFGNHGISKKIN